MSIVILAGGAAAITGAEGGPDLWGMGRHFAAFELAVMDPASTRAQLDTGGMQITLLGATYEIEVAPVPWQAHLDAVALSEDGAIAPPLPATWRTAAYHGRVGGVEGSRVLVVVMASGVAGTLDTGAVRIAFEPVRHLNDMAPPGLSVVHLASDVIEVPVADGGMRVLPMGTVTPSEGGVGPSSHEPPDRVMTLWADKEMAATTDWVDRVSTAWHRLNSEYNSKLGWRFTLKNDRIYYCDTSQCQSDWGMTSSTSGTLLTDWPNKIRTWSTISGFEIAALVTGKSLVDGDGNSINGAAWQPGRYSVTKGVSSLSQEQVSSILAHEVGHNFAGDHTGTPSCPATGAGTGTYGRARCYDHWHQSLWFHCHLPPQSVYQITRVCLDGHYHDDGSYHKHYTLMWSGKAGNRDFAPSSQNRQYMVECAGHQWTGGTYSPGGESGFGSWCTG